MASRTKKFPSFTIRLHGKDISPETIPVRTLSDAASAVMRLATGEDEDGSNRVHVLDVKRGSAVYPCLLDRGVDLEKNLAITGNITSSLDASLLTQGMLRPFRTLSDIANKFGACVEVYLGKYEGKGHEPIAIFQAETYKKIRGTAIVFDETTIHGELLRVGGSEGRRCSVRVAGRPNLLYCDVVDEKLSRRLGQHLYEPITLQGRGVFFARTWELISMKVSDFSFRTKLSTEELIRKLRASGGDAWDEVEDVDAEIRAMR
jgi:hypothetical protein